MYNKEDQRCEVIQLSTDRGYSYGGVETKRNKGQERDSPGVLKWISAMEG